MDRIRLAIVGCGNISFLNAPGYLQHPRCDVVALCDTEPGRAERRAREWGITPRVYSDFKQVLEDGSIDAVELLTPTWMHADQIVAALAAGKHVSCQKPLAITLAEANRIADAVGRARSMFRVTENFLYYPPILKAKELLDAGAILIGKTNMDQFATGLVGTRSPYGACSSIYDSRYISGGSSSGSAVAVAKGLSVFSLGTDTAGSGRVPAAFNNLIGLKPTRGLLSTKGVVPACRTLDCVSVFALTVDEAWEAFAAMAKDPAFLQDAGNMKADIVVNSGDEITALLAKTYASPRPLVERAIAEFKAAGGR